MAVRTAGGVILGVEKRLTSPLLEQTSIEKIHEVDSHIGVAISGLTADARTLVEHARVEGQSHRFTYDEPMRVESLTQSVCDLMMSFGEGGEENKSKMSRPFGVSLLLAGCDARGPQLFAADPSGTYVAYDAQVRGACGGARQVGAAGRGGGGRGGGVRRWGWGGGGWLGDAAPCPSSHAHLPALLARANHITTRSLPPPSFYTCRPSAAAVRAPAACCRSATPRA